MVRQTTITTAPSVFGGASADLPGFFQTDTPIFEELLEIDSSEPDGETITPELLEFFTGVLRDDMDEHFRSFEFGDTWMSNPIFTDEFAFYALPKALSDIVYELHDILQIRRAVPAGWNKKDARYSSLCESQQTRLRELIRETPSQYSRLTQMQNVLNRYMLRTSYPQIKFLITKTLDVVNDILRVNIRG